MICLFYYSDRLEADKDLLELLTASSANVDQMLPDEQAAATADQSESRRSLSARDQEAQVLIKHERITPNQS